MVIFEGGGTHLRPQTSWTTKTLQLRLKQSTKPYEEIMVKPYLPPNRSVLHRTAREASSISWLPLSLFNTRLADEVRGQVTEHL